jgi:hypothetical protein
MKLALGDGAAQTVLRRVVEDGLPTRVILCTGASDPIRLARAARLGPEAVFGKPVDIEEVLQSCGAAKTSPS